MSSSQSARSRSRRALQVRAPGEGGGRGIAGGHIPHFGGGGGGALGARPAPVCPQLSPDPRHPKALDLLPLCIPPSCRRPCARETEPNGCPHLRGHPDTQKRVLFLRRTPFCGVFHWKCACFHCTRSRDAFLTAALPLLDGVTQQLNQFQQHKKKEKALSIGCFGRDTDPRTHGREGGNGKTTKNQPPPPLCFLFPTRSSSLSAHVCACAAVVSSGTNNPPHPTTCCCCPWGRDALEGKGPQRPPRQRLDRRLEEVSKRLEAVTVGYKCR